MLYNFSMNPLDQFEIRDLISLNISFFNNMHISLTNITLYLILAGLLTLYLHLFTNNNLNLLSSK
jgi:F-type H+-transporting ATPase subunit a